MGGKPEQMMGRNGGHKDARLIDSLMSAAVSFWSTGAPRERRPHDKGASRTGEPNKNLEVPPIYFGPCQAYHRNPIWVPQDLP